MGICALYTEDPIELESGQRCDAYNLENYCPLSMEELCLDYALADSTLSQLNDGDGWCGLNYFLVELEGQESIVDLSVPTVSWSFFGEVGETFHFELREYNQHCPGGTLSVLSTEINDFGISQYQFVERTEVTSVENGICGMVSVPITEEDQIIVWNQELPFMDSPTTLSYQWSIDIN